LMTILKAARSLGGRIPYSLDISTRLTFPRDWGLGTSSTLIYTIAQWLRINPYLLLEKTFGGSGYDLACAAAKGPIIFQRKNNKPTSYSVSFNPPFKENLYFIYLGKKQNSREGIARYREKAPTIPPQYFDDISALTQAFLHCTDLYDFEKIIVEHENKVKDIIQLEPVKSLIFHDFWGSVKSLGAWGGDFVFSRYPFLF
jgi:mevalonate kinase